MDSAAWVRDAASDVAEDSGFPISAIDVAHTLGAGVPPSRAPATNPSRRYRAELEKIFGASRRAESMAPETLSVERGHYSWLKTSADERRRRRETVTTSRRVPYGPVDPEFVLLRVDDAAGRPRALLVHYATHAVVLGPTNCKYSADYPGVLQARTEAAIPDAQVMFVQGGAGDINPIFMARSGDEEKDFGVVQTWASCCRGGRARQPDGHCGAVGGDGISATSEIVTVKDVEFRRSRSRWVSRRC